VADLNQPPGIGGPDIIWPPDIAGPSSEKTVQVHRLELVLLVLRAENIGRLTLQLCILVGVENLGLAGCVHRFTEQVVNGGEGVDVLQERRHRLLEKRAVHGCAAGAALEASIQVDHLVLIEVDENDVLGELVTLERDGKLTTGRLEKLALVGILAPLEGSEDIVRLVERQPREAENAPHGIPDSLSTKLLGIQVDHLGSLTSGNGRVSREDRSSILGRLLISAVVAVPSAGEEGLVPTASTNRVPVLVEEVPTIVEPGVARLADIPIGCRADEVRSLGNREDRSTSVGTFLSVVGQLDLAGGRIEHTNCRNTCSQRSTERLVDGLEMSLGNRAGLCQLSTTPVPLGREDASRTLVDRVQEGTSSHDLPDRQLAQHFLRSEGRSRLLTEEIDRVDQAPSEVARATSQKLQHSLVLVEQKALHLRVESLQLVMIETVHHLEDLRIGPLVVAGVKRVEKTLEQLGPTSHVLRQIGAALQHVEQESTFLLLEGTELALLTERDITVAETNSQTENVGGRVDLDVLATADESRSQENHVLLEGQLAEIDGKPIHQEENVSQLMVLPASRGLEVGREDVLELTILGEMKHRTLGLLVHLRTGHHLFGEQLLRESPVHEDLREPVFGRALVQNLLGEVFVDHEIANLARGSRDVLQLSLDNLPPGHQVITRQVKELGICLLAESLPVVGQVHQDGGKSFLGTHHRIAARSRDVDEVVAKQDVGSAVAHRCSSGCGCGEWELPV